MTRKEKVLRQANAINSKFEDFLSFYNFAANDFEMNFVILGEACDRFFRDEERLLAAHGMERIDAHKTAGYMTYWLTHLKPICPRNYDLYKQHSEFCLYINELFAVCLAVGRLMQKQDIEGIRTSGSFLSAALYLLRYRITTGDNLSILFYLLEQ